MCKITVAINITADGFCNHTSVVADEAHHRFYNELVRCADAVLLGRTTYQLFESYWPAAANDRKLPRQMREFAWLINDAAKYVVSATLQGACWQHTTILPDLLPDTIAAIKKDKAGGNILVLGSPSVARQLYEAAIADEYYFSMQPFMAGSGSRLFDRAPEQAMRQYRLADTITLASAVSTLHYVR